MITMQTGSQQSYQQNGAGSHGAASNSSSASLSQTNDNTYLTALVASSVAVPIVAAMITVWIYVAPFSATWYPGIAVPMGAIITLIVWLLFAIPCCRFASARYANRCSYGSLINQLRDLRARLHVLDDRQAGKSGATLSDTCMVALKEARMRSLTSSIVELRHKDLPHLR